MTTPQPTGEAAPEGTLTFDEGIAKRFDARYRTREESANVDRALSVQVMEYVPDVVAALAELYRALRPGGWVGGC